MFIRSIIVPVLSVLAMVFVLPCRAELPIITSELRAKINADAQEGGFSGSVYPYYTACNGCGPDGFSSRWTKIMDKPPMFPGLDFHEVCNQHDEDYATIGMSKKVADKRLRTNMRRVALLYISTHRRELDSIQKREIKRLPDFYVDKIEQFGDKAYKVAQESQTKYEKWIKQKHPEVFDPANHVRKTRMEQKDVKKGKPTLAPTINVPDVPDIPDVW